MRAFLLVVVAAGSLVVGRPFAEPATTRPAVERSPHAEALRLVFDQSAGRIRAVDRENWWHDVKMRQWTAQRPFHPGNIDSTHLFEVSYRIDGQVVAAWSVDTRAGTVQETTAPAIRAGT